MPFKDPEKQRQYLRTYVVPYMRARRERLIAAGLCATCGQNPVTRFRTCRACREREGRRQKLRRDRLCDDCRCTTCGREAGAYVLCGRCRRRAQANARRHAKEDQTV